MRHMMVLHDTHTYADNGAGGVIADSSEVDLLANGAIAIFTEDGVLITGTVDEATTAAIIAGTHSVTFAVGGLLENDRWVRTFLRTEDNFYKFKAYVAPVAQVFFVGANGGGGSTNMPTPVAGDVAFIRLTMTTPIRDLTFDKYRFEYLVKSGDDEEAILTGLVASINLDLSLDVTAALVGTTGIQFTADNVGEIWSVGLDGLLSDADVLNDGSGTSFLASIGTGSNAEIVAMYEEFTPNYGDWNKTWLSEFFFSQNNPVEAAINYDLYNLYFSNKRLRRDGMQSVGGQELIIAGPAGGFTAQTELDLILDAIFRRDDYSTVTNETPHTLS